MKHLTLFAGRAFGLALAAALALGACNDGENPFDPPGDGGDGGDGGPTDATAPSVVIEFPADSATVALGDSVFTQVSLSDETELASLTLRGVALRGDPELGTQTEVERFAEKTVSFDGAAVQDTTILRYLLAADDTVRERIVYVVAEAVDAAGNASTDTVVVAIGGPSVRIAEPAAGEEVTAGVPLDVRVVATDAIDRVGSIRLRATGAVSLDTTLTLTASVEQVDTVISVAVPASATGSVQLEASAVSGSQIRGTSRPVPVDVVAPTGDESRPAVSFDVAVPARVETTDTLAVSVSASDETQLAETGATVIATRATAAGTDTLYTRVFRGGPAAQTFRLPLDVLPLTELDSAEVTLEVTAFGVDAAGNCGAATTTGSVQSIACAENGAGLVLTAASGRQVAVYFARGATVLRPNDGDVIADLTADGTRLFLSNLSRNRVEVLPLGERAYGSPVRVGSEPWGLAVGRGGDTLFVANSGGTNVSAIPLTGGTLAEAEGSRIFTRNEVLYDVTYKVGDGTPSEVVEYDYSDRPQFLAQSSNGLLVFSTKPTGAAPDGTVRIYRPRFDKSEIFIGYLGNLNAGNGIVVNARSAYLIGGDPATIGVCPRRRFGDASDPVCVSGDAYTVSALLDSLRALPANAQGDTYDTRLDLGVLIEEVGLQDTTFVAASTDRDFIAVGEGAIDRARIPLFEAAGDDLELRGDVRDLINNTDERVIGLGLNFDGSLGVARGDDAYFFNQSLRLQGVTPSGAPSGGVAMLPTNANYPTGGDRLAFISGVDAAGESYVDVVNTFNFFRISRIPLRDPVVGAMTVAPRAPSDPAEVALRLYAITSGGIVGIPVTNSDLGR